MHGPLRDQRGISSIVGFALVVALLMVAISVYITNALPYEWKTEEWDTMTEVKEALLALQNDINGLGHGTVASAVLKMGTPSPTAMVPAQTTAELRVTTARDFGDATEAEYDDPVFSFYRGYGTYVREDQPAANYTAADYENDHLLASTTEDHRMRTYLKFDLSDLYLYDSSGYIFYEDVEIQEAKLLLYCLGIDAEEEPDNVLAAAVPMVLEVWGVENDNWDERITWDNQPHDPAQDMKIENQSVDGDQEWAAWDVTPYVKNEFEKYRNWGKWKQEIWSDNMDGELVTGRFATATSDWSGYSNYYTKDAGVNVNYYNLTGDGNLTSMVFDAGDNNACWNYCSYSDNDSDNEYGNAPTVQVRFANNPDMTGATPWLTQGAPGPRDDMYARYVQYRVDPNNGTFYDITLEYTCHVSFVFREPEYWASTTLQNRVVFNSADNSQASVYGFDPRLRVTYSRRERAGYVGYASEGMVDFGSIKYMGKNQYMYDTNYVYEGGMVYLTSGVGWYAVMLAEPQDFITWSEAEGNNIYLTVTRYQIKSSSVTGESTGGTGYTSVRVQREEEENVVDRSVAPNRSKATITVNSDQPALWGSYLEQLAAEINYDLGGEWSPYGPYAMRDYDSVSLIVYGKDFDPLTQDIYYSERVVWLDTTVGMFQGGRT